MKGLFKACADSATDDTVKCPLGKLTPGFLQVDSGKEKINPKEPYFLKKEPKFPWPILQDEIPFRKISLDKKPKSTNSNADYRYNRFKIKPDEWSDTNERFELKFPSALKNMKDSYTGKEEVTPKGCPIWSSKELGRCPTMGIRCSHPREDCLILGIRFLKIRELPKYKKPTV